jgi:N-acetylglucosamine-6-phosphate deacetylase
VFVHFGHTDASREQLRAASAERSSFTHLGNACPQQLDRHDNILWRVLDLPELWCSVIADGIHVSPSLFRLIHRVKGDRVFYTTDAMSAAGAPPGRYALGKLVLEVGADGVVRQPGRTNFAGSSCTPLQAVLRAADMLDEPWQKAWKRLSDRPAQVIGMEGGLAEGALANFCVAVRGHTAGKTDSTTWNFQTYHHGHPCHGAYPAG